MQGKILVAEQQGLFLLKLLGDVRLTISCSLETYFAEMLSGSSFQNVVVDVSETEGIDSTSLGVLAKLAIQVKDKHGILPTIISTNNDITRLLESMGFRKLFNISNFSHTIDNDLGVMPIMECKEESAKAIVLEAHKLLMEIDDSNKERFSNLVEALEAS